MNIQYDRRDARLQAAPPRIRSSVFGRALAYGAAMRSNAASGLAPYITLGRMNMKLHPEAKMVDIRIVEVPCQWKGLVPEREIASSDNTRFIRLSHDSSGAQYAVEVEAATLGASEVARLRAEAKLAFIRALHGGA